MYQMRGRIVGNAEDAPAHLRKSADRPARGASDPARWQ
jgi:hypothetical protein